MTHLTADRTTQQLVKIGLSEHEALAYQVLLTNEALTASQIAAELKVLPNAVYRLMDDLVNNGFAVELNTRPLSFQSVPPQTAIDAYIKNRALELKQLQAQAISGLNQKNPKKTAVTHVDVLSSKQAWFKAFIDLAKTAREELFVISIGEPTGDAVIDSFAEACQRGVDTRLIVHRFYKHNEDIVKAWTYLGISVRHKLDAGYHLVVVDGNKCVLSANNPNHTEERTSMVINSPGVAGAMKRYFLSVWDEARTIDRLSRPE